MPGKGGNKVQAISEKYKVSMIPQNAKASDRFTAKAEIARQVNRNVTNLSSELCKSLIQNVFNNIHESRKR